MDDRQQQERRTNLQATLAHMRAWNPANRYYALTLLASRDGRALWSAHTHFAGQSDRLPGWEKRAASIVETAKMIALWNGVGQSWLVVEDRIQLGLWIRLGGNALVEVALGQKWLPHIVATREVAPDGPTGFLVSDALTQRQLKHRPSRGLRMRVLERDNYTCRRCGRAGDHVKLTRHHVLPHSAGGLTQENNLVTLCDDCHSDCHISDSWHPAPDLFGMLFVDAVNVADDDYDEAVRRHRRLIAQIAA